MLLLVLLLQGCGTSGRVIDTPKCPPPDPKAVCAGWHPILVDRADVVTDFTAKGILAHNEYGEAMGCWK